MVASTVLALGCERGCGASAKRTETSAGPAVSSAPISSGGARSDVPRYELALLEHYPARVAFSPGGHQLATLGHHEVVVWEAESGVPVHVLPGEAKDLAWSPDGKRIAVTDGGSIRLLELADDTSTTPLPADESSVRVVGLGWVDATELLALLDSGDLVRMPDGKPRARTRVFSRPIVRASFDPAHERVAVAPKEPGLPTEVATGADYGTRAALPWQGRDSVVLALAFSPDGSKLGGLDNRVENGLELWDAATHKALPAPRGPAGRVNDFAWSPDSRRLAVVGHESGVHSIDAKTGEVLRSRPLPGWNGEGVAFSPDGRTLAVTWRAFTLHDADSLEPNARLWLPPDDASHLACARDADELIAVGKNGDLLRWDLSRGELQVHPGLAADAFQVAWADSDTRFIVVAKHEVRVVDAKSAKVVEKLDLELPVNEQDLPSPDGKWLAQIRQRLENKVDGGTGAGPARPSDLPPAPEATDSRGGIGLQALPTDRPHLLLRSIPDGALRDLGVVAAAGNLAFSSDAKRLAVITDRGIEVFDVPSGRAIVRITTPPHGLGPMGSRYDPFAALSPDGGELVAPAPGFSELEVWRVSGGARERKFRGFGGEPLVWAADGQSIASGASWRSAVDGRVLAEQSDGSHQRPCFGPHGRWIAVASARDLRVVRRDGQTVRLRRVPVRLEWRPFVWQSDGHFDGDDETLRRVWLAERPAKPVPATDLRKLRQPGLVAEWVKGAK